MLEPTSSSASARSLWRISTPLARATTGSESWAKTTALGAARKAAVNAASASAPSKRAPINRVPRVWATGGRVEAIKRGPLAGRRFAGFMQDGGLNIDAGPGFGADTRPIARPWQRQNQAAG